MRSKDIISTIAFISAFAFSAAFASLFIDESPTYNFENYAARNTRSTECSFNDQTCKDVLAFLISDIRNGAQRRDNYDYSLGTNGNVSAKRAETVVDYVAASGSMDDSYLPSDFRSAWREHMNAWHDYSEFLKDVSRNKIEDDEFDRLESQYIYDINKTWASVLKIGRGYGAESPYVY